MVVKLWIPLRDAMMSVCCALCSEIFASRNKLFAHIAKSHGKQSGTSDNPSTQSHPAKRVKLDVYELENNIKTIEEDDNYRIICKPQGLATMGAKGPTLISSSKMLLPNALEENLSYKKAVPCHRLDRDTGGLVICSKNFKSQVALSGSFRYKFVFKKYLAMAAGRLEPSSGYITTPISNKTAITKYNVTHYTPSSQHGTVSTVELFPVTGRKHQLRRHLQSLGHSIVGDRRYSFAASWPPEQFPFMFLFAVGIELPHPDEYEKVMQMTGNLSTDNNNGGTAYNSDDDEDENDEEDVCLVDTTRGTAVEDKKYYGCVREDYVANNVKMIKVEIPEPDYYSEYRAYCEKDRKLC